MRVPARRDPAAWLRAVRRMTVALGAPLAVLVAGCGGGAAPRTVRGATDTASGTRPDSAAATMVGGRDSALVRVARAVLPAVERESGLTATRPLAVARTTRKQLETYMLGEFEEDLPPARARAVQETYVRLGLLPDSLDLPAFLRKLYLEQVVGYYDPKRDTLYVREGVKDAEFKPVLVHEMTHALQDEHMNLDSLMRAREDDNDASTAAHAALEGQATYVMLEWLVRQRTGSDVDLTTMRSLVDMVSGTDLLSAGASTMPELAAAPPFIRASLVFPYQAGLSFIQALWEGHPGRPAPLGADMPTSTEQVLHPARFLSDGRDVPTEIRFTADSASLEGGWRDAHTDDLGEFETRFFLSTFLGDTARARSAATGWDGDRYRLLRRCTAGTRAAATGPDPCAEAFIWASVWDRPEAAAAFAVAAREAFAARYGGAHAADPSATPPPTDTIPGAGRIVTVSRQTTAGRPTVLVLDRPVGADAAAIEAAARFQLSGGS